MKMPSLLALNRYIMCTVDEGFGEMAFLFLRPSGHGICHKWHKWHLCKIFLGSDRIFKNQRKKITLPVKIAAFKLDFLQNNLSDFEFGCLFVCLC